MEISVVLADDIFDSLVLCKSLPKRNETMQMSRENSIFFSKSLTQIIGAGLFTDANDSDGDDGNPKFHRRPIPTDFAFTSHNQSISRKI